MKTAISCRFEFQHTPRWRGGFYIGEDTQMERGCLGDGWGEGAKFEEFKADFIKEIQDDIILPYAHQGQIITPTNHAGEFWTPKFVLKLYDALIRPHKRPKFLGLKSLLEAGWESLGYCNMEHKELAENLNKVYGTKHFKAKSLGKYLMDNGFSTKRKPGPKPRAK